MRPEIGNSQGNQQQRNNKGWGKHAQDKAFKSI